jgi:hypothetical protein
MRYSTARGCVIAIVFAAGVAVSVSKEMHPKLPNNQTEIQNPKAKEQNSSPPPIIVNVSPPQKTHDEIQQETKNREEKTVNDRKLVEFTRQLADYTFGLFVATATLVLATICLGYLGWRQARDMKESIAVAKKSVNIAEQSLVSLERAFVFPESFNLWKPYGAGINAPYYFMPTWKNSGRTWTRRCINHINWSVFHMPIDESFDFPDFGNVETRVDLLIGPGATISGQRLDIPHHIVGDAIEGRSHLYFWGWCEYNDIFVNTVRHRTEFCVKLEKVTLLDKTESGRRQAAIQLTIHNKYNGADDDCLKPIQT